VEVDGRSAREGLDAPRHSAQWQRQRRPHVRYREAQRQPIDAAYNRTRASNEPLYEITQIKGTSETRRV